MPASNSLNYANYVEIKVDGGGVGFCNEKLGASELNWSALSLARLLLSQAKDLPHCEVNTKKGVFNKLGD